MGKPIRGSDRLHSGELHHNDIIAVSECKDLGSALRKIEPLWVWAGLPWGEADENPGQGWESSLWYLSVPGRASDLGLTQCSPLSPSCDLTAGTAELEHLPSSSNCYAKMMMQMIKKSSWLIQRCSATRISLHRIATQDYHSTIINVIFSCEAQALVA